MKPGLGVRDSGRANARSDVYVNLDIQSFISKQEKLVALTSPESRVPNPE
jgi:hypothetical protein